MQALMMQLPFSRFCLVRQLLINTSASNPSKTPQITKLDVGGVCALVCCGLPRWDEQMCTLWVPRKSLSHNSDPASLPSRFLTSSLVVPFISRAFTHVQQDGTRRVCEQYMEMAHVEHANSKCHALAFCHTAGCCTYLIFLQMIWFQCNLSTIITFTGRGHPSFTHQSEIAAVSNYQLSSSC